MSHDRDVTSCRRVVLFAIYYLGFRVPSHDHVFRSFPLPTESEKNDIRNTTQTHQPKRPRDDANRRWPGRRRRGAANVHGPTDTERQNSKNAKPLATGRRSPPVGRRTLSNPSVLVRPRTVGVGRSSLLAILQLVTCVDSRLCVSCAHWSIGVSCAHSW